MIGTTNGPEAASAGSRHLLPVGLAFLLGMAVACGGQSGDDDSVTGSRLPVQTEIDPSTEQESDIGTVEDVAEEPLPVPTAVTVASADPAEFDERKLIAGAGSYRYVPLTDPEFVTADEAAFLASDSLVLGLSAGDEHRAYPVRQMWFHHIVNDVVGGSPVLVTY